MGPSTLNICSELEYLLLGDLRALLQDPDTPERRQALLIILDRLVENLPQLLELRSAGGYMSDVLEEFPNWSRQAESLYSDDIACRVALENLSRRIRRASDGAELIAEIRDELDHWLITLMEHRLREIRLVLKASTLEVGGEG